MLDSLRRAVGGDAALDDLNAQPLPDEPFAWDSIPEEIHGPVANVLRLCDQCCDALLDVEYRTACRRLLARCATGKPAVFAGKASPPNRAAAISWIIGKANRLFTPGSGGMLVKHLTAHFGLTQGTPSQRATTLLRAGGFETAHYGGMDLGSPAYLVSSSRRRILGQRDRYRSNRQ